MADAFEQLTESKQPAGGGDYAPWWNDDNFDRQEGDELVGVIVEKHAYTDPGGGDHAVATLKMVRDCALPKGSEVATPTHTTVVDVVEDLDVGDLLLLEYTGTVKSNQGRDTNTYEYSFLKQEQWEDTDQADDIQEIWDDWDPEESDSAETDDTGGDDDLADAIEYAETCVKIQDGKVSLEDLDHYVNEVRDYGLDVEELVELSGKLELDGDEVTLA